MRSTSLRLAAIGWAMAMMAPGRTLGAQSDAIGKELPPRQVSFSPTWSATMERLSPGKREGPIQLTSAALSGSGPVEAISSAVKQGVNKVSDALTPSTPVKRVKDPISLTTKATPSPELYVAMARLSQQSGRVGEAERQYQQALRMNPQHAGALLGYARMKDRQGELEQATQLYQFAARAARGHPKEASVFNDLGVCLARRGMFNQSIAAFEQAIRLEPKKLLYRNNIAMVLVETKRVDAAASQIKAAGGEAIAYYNVAYMLQAKGDLEAARVFFAKALQKNPSLTQARIWLAKLQGRPGSVGPSAPRIATQARPGVGPSATPGRPGSGPQGLRPAPSPTPTFVVPHGKQAGPRLGAPAPLPPPTSVRGPVVGDPRRPGAPVVQPLPPVGNDSRRP